MAKHSFLHGFGRDILNADPDAAFFGKIAQLGNTRLQEFYRGQGGSIYDRFVGSQGLDFSFDREPRFKEFPDFLDNFDFLREFQSRSPSDRGEFPSRFAPRVRFNA